MRVVIHGGAPDWGVLIGIVRRVRHGNLQDGAASRQA